MDKELSELVMLERVEMIARLTADGVCQERDREIALNLIAEIARSYTHLYRETKHKPSVFSRFTG